MRRCTRRWRSLRFEVGVSGEAVMMCMYILHECKVYASNIGIEPDGECQYHDVFYPVHSCNNYMTTTVQI